MRRDILKQHIFKSGSPQWKVGAKAGISETRLSAIVRGKVNPTEKERAALSGTLGVEQSVLFPDECQEQLAATM
jgi:transcriptional regulator with XRE-family HTH domain